MSRGMYVHLRPIRYRTNMHVTVTLTHTHKHIDTLACAHIHKHVLARAKWPHWVRQPLLENARANQWNLASAATRLFRACQTMPQQQPSTLTGKAAVTASQNCWVLANARQTFSLSLLTLQKLSSFPSQPTRPSPRPPNFVPQLSSLRPWESISYSGVEWITHRGDELTLSFSLSCLWWLLV